jgi:hypothetical protein
MTLEKNEKTANRRIFKKRRACVPLAFRLPASLKLRRRSRRTSRQVRSGRETTGTVVLLSSSLFSHLQTSSLMILLSMILRGLSSCRQWIQSVIQKTMSFARLFTSHTQPSAVILYTDARYALPPKLCSLRFAFARTDEAYLLGLSFRYAESRAAILRPLR